MNYNSIPDKDKN